MPYNYTFSPKPPYCFTLHLEGFSVPGEPMPWIYEPLEKCCRRLYKISNKRIPVKTCFRGEPWRPEIEIKVYTRDRGYADKAFNLVVKAVRGKIDYNEFTQKLSSWPKVLEMVEQYPGLRPGRSISLYEALIDSVIKQRIALKASLRMQSRLVKSLGNHIIIGKQSFYSFPEPEKLVNTGIDELRGIGLTRMKAEAIKSVAGAEYEGRLPSIREIEEANDLSNITTELTRIRGIGPWTAELAVAQVHPLFPIGPRSDLAVRRGFKTILGLNDSTINKIISELGNYAGLLMYIVAFHYEATKKKLN
jgi:DNA-3-methyladenine glycosylase II